MSETRESSYVAGEVPIGLDRELERLRSQALVSWPKEARNLGLFGLREDMSVLEVGSGPGFVTEQLLTLVPMGSVTALEIDPLLIEKAQSYLGSKGEGRLRIVQGNVMHSGLPDNTFDFAYARYLFQHLPDPVGAATEIKRVLKPGGKLVIFDVDDTLNIFDPPPAPEAKLIYDRLMESMQKEQADKGGNRLVGRRLLHILADAGFQHLDLEGLVMHNRLSDLSIVIPKPSREDGEMMVKNGLINEKEMEMVLADTEAFYASDHTILIFMLMACGEKP